MRFGSVCSGIEAASAAWLPLGWRHAFLSEIEAFPRAVLKHHYPEAPLHGDFTTIQAGEYDPIDLLVGGTPCQDFSVAGLRAGMAGDRGNLTLQFLTLARRLRPRWVVWENVPGVLSSNGGRDFGAFLGGLGELGYGWAYRTLDAQFFGVAQRRRRVFVVGYLGDWRRAAAVLFERHCLSGHPAPSREAGEGVAPPIAGCANGGGANGPGRTADDAESLIVPILDGAKGRTDKRGSRDGSALGEPGDPMFTLRDGSSHAIAFALRGREGGAMPEVGGDQAGALRAASGGSTRDYVALEVVGTLAANMGQGNQFAASGQFVAFSTAALHGSAVRRRPPPYAPRVRTPPGLPRRLHPDPVAQGRGSRRPPLQGAGQFDGRPGDGLDWSPDRSRGSPATCCGDRRMTSVDTAKAAYQRALDRKDTRRQHDAWAALAAYQRALDRKDTRRQHDAWAALRAARVAQMVAEQAERDRRKGLFRRLLSWGRSNA